MDSEYYLKKYLQNEILLKSNCIISNFCEKSVKNIKSQKIIQPFEYLEISGVSLKNFEYSKKEILPSEIPDRATYLLQNNDVVVSMVRPNRNAIAFIQNEKMLVGTSGFAILRNNGKISPQYLFAFCKTKHFITKLMRENTATMYPSVSEREVFSMPIPILTEEFRNIISKNIQFGIDKLKQSRNLYTDSESLLLSSLGLSDFKPSTDSIAIKPLSESFCVSGRMDAEYYQKKYEDIVAAIKCSNGVSPLTSNQTYRNQRRDSVATPLGDLVKFTKSIEPGSEYYGDEGVPFIRVSDLSKFGINEPEIKIPEKIVDPHLYLKKDTILLSKDGSVGIAYKLEEDKSSVTSGALLHLKVISDVLPDYLTLVLNSFIVQMQAQRDTGGSVIPHWRPEEIKEVLIPIVDANIQDQISDLVQRSFSLRRESERLLESAKKGVEIAIEEGEDVAMEYLLKLTSCQ